MKIKVASLTDTGLMRKNNEDSLLVCPDLRDIAITEMEESIEVGLEGALFAVADGMGGTVAGEEASRMAIKGLEGLVASKVFKPGLPKEEIERIFDVACMGIQISMVDLGQEDPDTLGMGTTLVMGLIREGVVHLAWVGDSRCYLYRKGSGLSCMTKDHSYVQLLLDQGSITPDEAFHHPHSNFVTRYLWCEDDDESLPDHTSFSLKAGDRLLFCSDGVNGMLRDREIEEVMAEEAETRACVQRLVSDAIARGGKDNITAIVVDLLTIG